MTVLDRLAALGLTLPPPPPPAGLYQPAIRSGALLYVSGQLNLAEGKLTARGTVGESVSADVAQDAARQAALNCLAAAAGVLDSLDQIRQVVRLTGYVASAPGFTDQPAVINGASAVFRDIFGERGVGSRLAIGVAALPLGAPVEVDVILEIEGP